MPVACLRNRHHELGASVTKLQKVRGTLLQNLAKVEEVVEEKSKLLAGGEALLEEGRQIASRRAQQGEKGPVWFANQYYTESTFTAQLGVLLNERKSLTGILASARQQKTAMEQQAMEVMIRLSESETARNLLPSQIALLEAQDATAGLQESYKTVRGLLNTADTSIERAMAAIGSTQELLRGVAAGNNNPVTVMDAEVEAFLRQEGVPPKPVALPPVAASATPGNITLDPAPPKAEAAAGPQPAPLLPAPVPAPPKAEGNGPVQAPAPKMAAADALQAKPPQPSRTVASATAQKPRPAKKSAAVQQHVTRPAPLNPCSDQTVSKTPVRGDLGG